LKEAKLPTELLALLKTLKNQQYATQQQFLRALNALGECELMTQYQSVILQHLLITVTIPLKNCRKILN